MFCAVRDYQEEEMDLIRRHKIPLYSVAEITQKGISSTVEEIFKKTRILRSYLCFVRC
ncbi:hypothetical protein [Psychrobacter sp. JCM 18901]|uniref:hypothetical protein n=1 Tax=Psychrobacter sp. JCM 18901 TaxID=1298609 RepID=UPI0021C38A5E|nr:hypothetical protein [Psychrobacter sp. JCM 18901]